MGRSLHGLLHNVICPQIRGVTAYELCGLAAFLEVLNLQVPNWKRSKNKLMAWRPISFQIWQSRPSSDRRFKLKGCHICGSSDQAAESLSAFRADTTEWLATCSHHFASRPATGGRSLRGKCQEGDSGSGYPLIQEGILR
jgi:hypothetical protein